MKKSLLAGTAGLLVAAIFSGAVLSGKAKAPHLKTPPPALAAGLTLYWIDTEGGAATLLVTPAGESVLIDSGNPGGRDAERIFRVAREAGLKQIDHLVTTHWHRDHYGGAAELFQKMPIARVIDKGIPERLEEDAGFARNIQPYRDMAVPKRTLLRPGNPIPLRRARGKETPALALRVVGVNQQFSSLLRNNPPGQGCADTTDKPADASDNANSLVLVLDYGPFRFFAGGDLTWNVEKKLVCPRDLIGQVDVFQVNHHGLDQSNNPVLVQNLAPTVTIMGNGPHKGAGPQTIRTLRQVPSIRAQYQLHKNIRPDSVFNTSAEYIANRTQTCQANYVKLAVAPDGKSYTVHIPATNHRRTFRTRQ